MEVAAGAADTADRDTAESDRLAGVSRRLSAVESKLSQGTDAPAASGGGLWLWLLAPGLLIVAAVAFLVHKRKPAPENK